MQDRQRRVERDPSFALASAVPVPVPAADPEAWTACACGEMSFVAASDLETNKVSVLAISYLAGIFYVAHMVSAVFLGSVMFFS